MSENSTAAQDDASAIADAESEGMPAPPVVPRAEPMASGHAQRRWGLVRNAGTVAAALAVLGAIAWGSVLLVRRRRH